MSDGTRARSFKLKVNGPTSGVATPQTGSRPGSPAPIQRPASSGPVVALPSEQEIRAAIPAEGITIKDLMARVAHPKDKRTEFVTLIKRVARMNKATNLLVIKD